jgi:hypothetical protein
VIYVSALVGLAFDLREVRFWHKLRRTSRMFNLLLDEQVRPSRKAHEDIEEVRMSTCVARSTRVHTRFGGSFGD